MTPTEARTKLLEQGYQPIPTVGKRPPFSGWTKRGPTSAGDIEVWSKLYANTNTGILCATEPCLDIDIEDPDAADAVEALVRERFEEHGNICVRFGRSPRRAIFFKAATPFKHAERNFIAPNGDTKQKVEMLANGRQVIVHGIHEGTGKPYAWFGASLCETPRDKLPEIDEAGTDTLLDYIARVLVDAHGYQLAPSRKVRSGNGHDTDAAGADWQVLQHDIIAGHSLHESLRDLSCKMVCAGMEPGAVVNFLRGLMEQSATRRDQRWQERVSDIPRLVDGAVKLKTEGSKPKRGNGPDIAAEAGAALLDDVRSFLCRFVSYPSEHAAIAHTLWIAHTHLMSAWESTARLAFLSPEPGSGKTRALEVTELVVPNPISTMNATSPYLFRRCGNQDDGTPTILFDEVDALFGPKAKENEDIRAFINSGHRRGATFGRCVVRGKIIETEEIESYAAVALAGLGWLPDTIMSRSVVIRMRRRAPDEHIEAFRHRVHAPVGKDLCRRLATWAGAVADAAEQARPDMPIGVEDRNADMWEPLLAVADLAGSDWPKLAREAAVALIAAGRETPKSLNLLLLSDLRTVFENNTEVVRKAVPEGLSTKAILAALVALEDAPWRDLKGKPLDANGLAIRLRHYEVRSQNLRPDGTDRSQCKGYHLADLADVWRRYLPPSQITPSQPSRASQAGYFQEDSRDGSEAEAVPSGSEPSQEGENPPKKPTSGTAGTAGTALAGGGQEANGGEESLGLSPYLIRHLARCYLERFEQERLATGTVQQNALDAELRAVLADHGVFPEFIAIEFKRVMATVFGT